MMDMVGWGEAERRKCAKFAVYPHLEPRQLIPPYDFIEFGAMDDQFAYEFIGLGAMDG